MVRAIATVILLIFTCTAGASDEAAVDKPWARLRAELMAQIESEVFETRHYTGVARLDRRVTAVIGRVPRHEFVPASQQRWAYENRPLPIGHGQTISQPYIVALMTVLLDPQPDDIILEIGTGSGYQAAVLAELVRSVYSMEIVAALARSAAQRIKRLGYDNVEVKHADGYFGWPEHGPFDSIIITAAGTQIPPPLIDQLKPGGKMILPVGGQFTAQHLVLLNKHADGKITTRQILPVQFVPLTRER
jgi:protein-L-isoaspartate(D-aspartate) O-methyltransferase